MKPKFSIQITTKNRLHDLKMTLEKLKPFLADCECQIYDDASEDNTYTFIQENYPAIILHKNDSSKGLIHNRNLMLNHTNCEYVISLDDDAHFITDNFITEIEDYFTNNPSCGVQFFRIFWNKMPPLSISSNETPNRVKSFVGCGHVWRKSAWEKIPNYPEWFIFYGEEDFASYHLFKQNIEIHYNPNVLVHHRVDVKSRKKDKDYIQRTRRSLRAAWYLYLMFYPVTQIPRKIGYSIFAQIKLKFFKGDFKATYGLILAVFDVFLNVFNILKNTNRLSKEEMNTYQSISDAKIYWTSENDTN